MKLLDSNLLMRLSVSLTNLTNWQTCCHPVCGRCCDFRMLQVAVVACTLCLFVDTVYNMQDILNPCINKVQFKF